MSIASQNINTSHKIFVASYSQTIPSNTICIQLGADIALLVSVQHQGICVTKCHLSHVRGSVHPVRRRPFDTRKHIFGADERGAKAPHNLQ